MMIKKIDMKKEVCANCEYAKLRSYRNFEMNGNYHAPYECVISEKLEYKETMETCERYERKKK